MLYLLYSFLCNQNKNTQAPTFWPSPAYTLYFDCYHPLRQCVNGVTVYSWWVSNLEVESGSESLTVVLTGFFSAVPRKETCDGFNFLRNPTRIDCNMEWGRRWKRIHHNWLSIRRYWAKDNAPLRSAASPRLDTRMSLMNILASFFFFNLESKKEERAAALISLSLALCRVHP